MPLYVSDDLVLKDNQITSAQSNADVQIVPNGSGSLAIDTVSIQGNQITTNSSNANLELAANSSGYVRVIGTGALGIPVGTTGERPTAVAGQLRLNTTTESFEGYDGTSWGSLAGSSSAEADTSNTVKVTKTAIGTTVTTVDSFTTSAFQAAKYNYVVHDEINSEFETGFLHLVHDASLAYVSQYGVTHTGSSTPGSFTADISGSTVRLRFTGSSTTNSVTLFRTGLGDNSSADSSSTNTGLSINADVDSAQESLDTTNATTYRAVQFFILASQTTGDGSTVGHECVKINVTHDGTTAYHSEYGRISTTDAHLMSFDVDINSGFIRLLGTGATANTTVKIYKIQIKDSEEAATGDNVSIIVNTDVDSAVENIDTFENSLDATTTFQAAHYFNSVKATAGVGGAEYQVSEVVVVGDGGNTVLESEFGIVTSGNRQLLTYSTDYNNTTARLRAIGATTNLVVNGYRVNMERKGGGVSAASVVLNASDQTIAGVKTFTGGITLNDDVKLKLGTGGDLEIYHDGSNSYIDDAGTGTIFYRSGTQTFMNAAGSKTMVTMNAASSVELNFNNNTKFETTNLGVALTGVLRMAVESGDPSTVTNTAHIYAKDDSSSAEVFVQDEAGNVTKISPHNAQGEWEYYSRNTKTGKTVRVNMEEMIRDIEQLTGKTYIQNI